MRAWDVAERGEGEAGVPEVEADGLAAAVMAAMVGPLALRCGMDCMSSCMRFIRSLSSAILSSPTTGAARGPLRVPEGDPGLGGAPALLLSVEAMARRAAARPWAGGAPAAEAAAAAAAAPLPCAFAAVLPERLCNDDDGADPSAPKALDVLLLLAPALAALLLLLLFLLCPWVCTYAEDGAAGACVGWLAYSWAWGPPVAWPCCCSCCACHCACWRTLCKPRTMKFLKVGDAAPSIASMSCPGLAAVKKYRSTSAWCRSAEFSAMRLNMTDSRPRAAGSSATRWQ
mmetsp:Transcript_31176/g.81178  ORF Transcript_31176/g.81178 Transcript_31176/m.81178 type:complete len:286 (+) Transcript_31176:953-1810(+)